MKPLSPPFMAGVTYGMNGPEPIIKVSSARRLQAQREENTLGSVSAHTSRRVFVRDIVFRMPYHKGLLPREGMLHFLHVSTACRSATLPDPVLTAPLL